MERAEERLKCSEHISSARSAISGVVEKLREAQVYMATVEFDEQTEMSIVELERMKQGLLDGFYENEVFGTPNK